MKSSKDQRFEHMQGPSLPLSLVKGIGPKRAELFRAKGLDTVLDLFYFMPVGYEDRSNISAIGSADTGSPCLVTGTVTEGREVKFYPSRKRIYKIAISDDKGDVLELIWFRYIRPHLAGMSRPGLKITAYGTVKINGTKRQMIHPDISMPGLGLKDCPGFVPVYGSVKGISGNTLRAVIKASLDHFLEGIMDPVPAGILGQLGLPDLKTSLRGVHFPPVDASPEQLERAETPFHKRLVFDRFFFLMLIMAFMKKKRDRISTQAYAVPRSMWHDLMGFFTFGLTSAQAGAVRDIEADLASGRPMNRMLMGDVGTGKTAVAAIAAYITVLNNRQAALMAPTQILAEQHMEYFSRMPGDMGFNPVLITGGMKRGERTDAYGKVRQGEYNLIIGTQSLISEDLSFRDLGLAVIDEQHRFGVRQRAMIERKGNNPHVLVMTATPIPRSLAIAVYGDMDISMINEYPKGRRPVKTCLIDGPQKKWAFERLKECISSGRQAFVICPVIDETEDSDLKGAQEMHERLKRVLGPGYRVGLIHGRMTPDEREGVMQGFYRGDINVLVATTVIEVGVHVPNATVMVIEHPERFGLAQLHQLRGRVGRGTEEGLCMMILPDNVPEPTMDRMRVIAEITDGFEIAQKDLEFRGHGELTGLRQAGIGEIEPSEMIKHQGLLMEAKRLSWDLVQSDPDLSQPEHRYLKTMMTSISAKDIDL